MQFIIFEDYGVSLWCGDIFPIKNLAPWAPRNWQSKEMKNLKSINHEDADGDDDDNFNNRKWVTFVTF